MAGTDYAPVTDYAADAVPVLPSRMNRAVIPVVRTGATFGAASANYSTFDDNAKTSVDYLSVAGIVSFAPGSTLARSTSLVLFAETLGTVISFQLPAVSAMASASSCSMLCASAAGSGIRS